MKRAAALSIALTLALVVLAASASGSATSRAPAKGSGVIVRARPGQTAAAETLVANLGGTVRLHLGIIGGFSATLPARAVAELRASGLVLSVTRDSYLEPQSASYTADYDPSH